MDDKIQSLLSEAKPRRDGDIVDRFNYSFTTILLAIFSALIVGWSFVGTVIECWYPPEFKGWWIQYADDYCYVSNTYFLPFHEGNIVPANREESIMYHAPIPKNITERMQKVIPYYQWTYVVLALQAISFYLPIVIWRGLCDATGLFVTEILKTSSSGANCDPETRKKNMKQLARFMDYSCGLQVKLRKVEFTGNFWHGYYVMGLYLFVKLLFLVNTMAQFAIMNSFLAFHPGSWWGASVLYDIARGRTWQESGAFPRVSMCDFEVRDLGNLRRYTVQCVLTLNLYVEQIYLFLWWWFFFLSIMNIISFIHWLVSAILFTFRGTVVQNLLDKEVKNQSSVRVQQSINNFVRNYLKADGVFIVKLIALNAGDLVASEFVRAVWDNYLERNPGLKDYLDSLKATPAITATPAVNLASAPPAERQTPGQSPPPYEDTTTAI